MYLTVLCVSMEFCLGGRCTNCVRDELETRFWWEMYSAALGGSAELDFEFVYLCKCLPETLFIVGEECILP